MTPVPLGVVHDATGPWYLLVLALAAVGGAVLLGGGLAAYVRRQSRPYLLVALALAALVARTALGASVAWGVVDAGTHHFGEHVLDVVMAGLVIAAVYYARTTEGTAS